MRVRIDEAGNQHVMRERDVLAGRVLAIGLDLRDQRHDPAPSTMSEWSRSVPGRLDGHD